MERKNLCAQIPITLHQRVTQGKEASDCQTLGDYITEVLTAYYDYIEHNIAIIETFFTSFLSKPLILHLFYPNL